MKIGIYFAVNFLILTRMNRKKARILQFVLLMITMSVISRVSLVGQITTVFAGEDSGVCDGEAFDLSLLNASISGVVSDGDWLSGGDGIFMPDNSGNGQFSVSTHYIPGSLDFQNGGFVLTLASDPDPGNGNIFTDQVFVHLLDDVQPFCNSFLNVSLSSECVTVIGYEELVVNPNMPVDVFDVLLIDEKGIPIPGDSLTYEHIGQTIEYTVTHACSGQSCYGVISVDDKFVPNPICEDTILSCLNNIIPDSLGFPVVTDSIPFLIDDNTYQVINGDNCSDLFMSFDDHTENQDCSSNFERIIERTWVVSDENGNSSSCIQNIFLERADLDDVVFPVDRDGITGEVVSCDDNMLVDENGNPLPIVTGEPNSMNCQFLESTYDDLTIDFCGATKKIIRTWHIIEWCSTQTLMHNQIIVTADTLAPVIVCPESLVLETGEHECQTDNAFLTLPIVNDACSEFSVGIKIFDDSDLVFSNQNITDPFVQIDDLPLGTYEVEWKAQDACTNDTICYSILEVIDMQLPSMVCLQETQISLGPDGIVKMFPESVDLGSFDNCELDHFELRRLESACGGDTEFAPFVEFCCEDIGDTVMVVLKAVDHVGLENFCQVSVLVEDKLRPILTCPSDLTVSCETWYSTTDLNVFGQMHDVQSDVEQIIIDDAFNNGFAGFDGFFVDNCGAIITESIVEEFECHQGQVQRIFTATDDSGNVDSCIQFIQVINPTPLTEDDIIWPDHVDIDTCANISLDSDLFGQPSWNTGFCSMIAFSFHDEVFGLTTDACVKVIRSYTLIDWCQFDEATGQGLFEFTQVINFSNSVAPEFIDCDSTSVCVFGSCGDVVDFQIEVTDDCTATDDISINFQLDIDNDGTVEFSGVGNNFSHFVSPGIVSIKWLASDQCGNVNTCEQIVTVEDCKNPAPYCLGSFTTTIGNDGFASVWTNDVDLGGTDNCTEDLILSFSDTAIVDNLVFTCADIPNGISERIDIDLWYFDEAGNGEFCTVELVLQDQIDLCPNGNFEGSLTGNVTNSREDGISQVNINLESSNSEYNRSTVSELGAFAFNELLSEADYELTADREDSWLSGVSTIDILQIQNHILGKTPLQTGYDVRAADVNLSGSVTAVDLVTIRRLILGQITAFPNAESPWIFVKRDDELAELNPFNLFTEVDVELESEHNLLDLVGLKMGDANVSALINFADEDLESRSNSQIFIRESQTAYGYNYEFYHDKYQTLEGFEMFLNASETDQIIGLSSDLIEGFGNEFYYYNDGQINISWSGEALHVEAGTPLFIISSNEAISFDLNNARFSHYIIDEQVQLRVNQMIFDDVLSTNDCSLLDLIYDANSNMFRIQNQGLEADQLKLSLFDLSGGLVYSNQIELLQSKEVFIRLENGSDIIPGAYVLHSDTGNCKQSSIITIIP